MTKEIKYQIIYKDIKEKINNNEYKIDEKLPTGIELAEKLIEKLKQKHSKINIFPDEFDI